MLVRFPAPAKARPAVVLTRDDMIPHLGRITIAPISSTIRAATSEVVLGIDDGMKAPCAVNLFNIATVTKAMLGRRIATLSPVRMRQICNATEFALGCLD